MGVYDITRLWPTRIIYTQKCWPVNMFDKHRQVYEILLESRNYASYYHVSRLWIQSQTGLSTDQLHDIAQSLASDGLIEISSNTDDLHLSYCAKDVRKALCL